MFDTPYSQVQALNVERLLLIMLAKQCRKHGTFNGRDAGDVNDTGMTCSGQIEAMTGTMDFEEDHFHGTGRKPR